MTYIIIYTLKVMGLMILCCAIIMVLVVLVSNKEKRDKIFNKIRRR